MDYSDTRQETRDEAEAEGRRDVRGRVFLGVIVVHGEALIALSCRARDWSERGARLELPALTVLPRYFWLLSAREEVAHRGRLAWRRGDLAGVTFIGARSLVDPADLETRSLRRIWLERMPR